jgi:phosphatidylglycerophosphatase A
MLLFFYSFYAVNDAESEFKNKDPRQIVIDEVLGQAMPIVLLLYLMQNNELKIQIEIYYVLSFIFFRFFDILKPFPVSYFDKNYKNYFGIIMDDIMAGLYSMLLIYLISLKF